MIEVLSPNLKTGTMEWIHHSDDTSDAQRATMRFIIELLAANAHVRAVGQKLATRTIFGMPKIVPGGQKCA